MPIKTSTSEPTGVRVLDRTGSFCSTCGATTEALIVERDGRVYQRSTCPTHPVAERLLFSDAAFYGQLDEWNRRVFGGSPLDPASDGDEDGKPPLLAVIDLTNRCNYQCPVCFADTVPARDTYYLDLPTVRRMLQSLIDHGTPPCRHIQFSGGEPTLHPRFIEIVRMARDMGFTHIQVATNGSRFENPDFVQQAEDAGLHTLYLQFDGMDDAVYMALRGRPLVAAKIRAVENVAATSMRIVLVPTVVPGVNVHQLAPIFRFAVEHRQHITGISVQPMADTGRVRIDRPQNGNGHGNGFNLADMAIEFSRQTGLTRFPADWFPLNALSVLTRTIARLRTDASQHPACDAHCSVGTYFYIDDNGQATCLSRFLDIPRLLELAGTLKNDTGGALRRQISRLQQLHVLSSCFDRGQAPAGLTFQRVLRGLDGWEDKTVGRSAGWFQRGFNGMFVAGMHFMDAGNYSFRRLRRCIIKYVTTDGEIVSFCRYNAGERYRSVEESRRLNACLAAGH